MTRAPYASDPAANRGRLHAEPESRTRSAFQRDRDRIIHSTAFRRLKHKTQVFVYHEGDHFRTRLTHSLEVAQIARSIARTLGLDEDLAEALALSHDLGHTCFGHAGEDALAMCMAPYGGFDHNAHALRLVTRLELRYPEWDGLNLTWDTLEGLVKHNGPLVTPERPFESLPEAIREYNAVHDLWLSTYAGLEAQVAALSDDIAYNNHDIDDGLRAELFTLDDLTANVPLVREVFAGIRRRHPALDQQRLVAEAVRDLIGIMVDDVLGETRRRLAVVEPRSADDVRHAPQALVAFSDGLLAELSVLRRFLFERMYHHHKVDRVRQKMKRLMVEMFDLFIEQPALMPPEWSRHATAGPKTAQAARVVSDYIAGMTDRFAVQEHRRLFSPDVLA